MCLTALGLILLVTGSAGAQLGQGKVLWEYWFGGGVNDNLDNLKANANFPDNPAQSEWRDGLDRPDVASNDNWGGRGRAFLTPAQTGDYTFWTASDDDSELWLSTDDNPANAVKIANVEGWCNYQNWTGPGESPGPNRQSAPIPLVAGKKYYIELLFSDGTGGGHASVAWAGPGVGAAPTVLKGDVLTALIRDPEPLFRAMSPKPAGGAVDVTDPLFQWTPGITALMHEVYMGTNPTPGAAEFMGPWPMAMYFHVPGLTPGATYYWRVDEVDAAGVKYAGDVWSFTVMPLTAHAPSPANGALLKGSDPAPKLSWTAGQNVVSHNVYFGTDKALVTAADASVAVAMAQAVTTFDAGALQPITTYYWRVDEVDAAGAVQAGAVWSFRITDPASDMNTENWSLGIAAAGPKFLKTYVADGVYDIGTFGDEQTYEFVVRSNPDEVEASMCLIGRRDVGDTKVGLKYEQWNNTKTYGATAFGVADYDFKVPTAPGEYTHLVFVASKAGAKTDLYVNGELKGSVAAAISLSGQVGIGYGLQNRPPAAPMFDNFDGDIFGVAIYDRALSADEIAANADKYFNPIPITDPDLLFHYTFEGGSGAVVLDQSGHSNHADFIGSPQWTTDPFGGCLSVNAATGDGLTTKGALGIVSNTVTVSGWVKHDASPAAWSGIFTHRGTSPGSFGLQHNGTELRYMWGADVYWSFSSGLNMPNGEWYFAAVAVSPTQGKLYLNGIAQTATNVAEHVPTNFDKQMGIGWDIGFASGRFMTGLIDDVRFYSKTLTDVDVQRLVLSDVTAPGDTVQGVPNDNDWPGAEHPALAIDDDATKKYLHFKGGQLPTGFQVTPAVGATLVTGLTLTTANDDYGRDPVKFELSGSNDSINGPWTVIAAGDVVDFAQATLWPRFTMNASAISFANAVAYKHYQVLFPGLRNPAASTLMQIGEVELLGYVVEPPNLLPNGGFESGEIGPYGIYGAATGEIVTDCVGATVPEGPIEGKYCLHVVVPAAGANFWDIGMTDGSYTFKAGKKYKFSAWVKTKSGTLEINMKPEHGAANWEAYGEKRITATDTWQEFSTTSDVIPADVTPASPTFHIGFAASEFWMDNIKLQEVE
jgi:hypothetical protein